MSSCADSHVRFHVLTLFPEMVSQGLSASVTGRAFEKGIISLETINIRDYTLSKHKKVDDYPYGGGAGMLMQAQPVYDAFRATVDRINESGGAGEKARVIYVTPQGRCFRQDMAKEFAEERDLIFLCGHYEGIDQRFIDECVDEEISLGDFVLTGGEIAAMAVADAVCRLVPGVLADAECFEKESHWDGLLEYPQYSRPAVWHNMEVPEILSAGDHAKIERWRRKQSLLRTR